MTVQWFPLTMTIDTMDATDCASADDMLPFDELKRETRAYVVGDRPPHFPVPATIPNAWCAQAFVFLAARLEDWCIAPLPAQMENLWLDLSGK